jgi:P4 family phage/plasmid primase-like protien
MADRYTRAGYRCSRKVDIEECIAAKGLTTLRLAVARNGYRPVPISGPTMKVDAAGKRPLMKNWREICADADEAEIARWTEAEPKCTNTGLLCGELVGIDVDVLAPDLVEKIIATERSMLGGTPLVRIGKAPKTLLCYRVAARFTKMETPELFLVDGSKAQIEVLAEGQQFVAYGIHPDTLRPYEWLHGGPDTMPWADLPVVTEEACRRFVAEAEAILRAAGGRTKAEIEGKATKTASPKSGAKVIDFGKASGDSPFFREVNRRALDAIETWFPKIFPTARQEPGTGAWRVSSKDLNRPYEEDLSMHPTEGGRDFGTEKSVSPVDVVIEWGSAADAVQAALWLCDQLRVIPATLGWKKASKDGKRQSRNETVDPVSDHPASAHVLSIGSDVEIAGRVVQDLVDRFGEVVSCDGAFWRYTGTHWEAIADESLWLAVHAYDGDQFPTTKGKSVVKLGKSRIESILACMKPEIARPDFFAEAAVGINCASGFIRFDDQGTPALESHSPDHRCRHVLAGRWPASGTEDLEPSSLLHKLLDGCFRDDPDQQEKIDLLAEVAGAAALGYATKVIKPKALVLKGETAENGKSQVLDLMRALLPKEAVSSISPARFDDRTFACHLAGKLLNAPDELASTDALASEIFKQIITGDPLTVRDVYKSAFDFRPLAQHVYATNNLPTFKGGMDRGVQRRLMLLTFNRVIPEAERVEHIGILIGREEPDLLLDWAVRGARRVIKNNGFNEPASSKAALADWMYSADPVLGWLESDRVTFRENDFIPEVETKVAYRNFKQWAVDEGFSDKKLPAINGFVQRVVAAKKGITKERTNARRYFRGLACTDGHFG